MSLPYPENTIWYVEASHFDDSDGTSGSAVAIRLQKINDPQSADTYLITCAHVLRGKTRDQKPGYGAPLPKIQVWQSDTAYKQGQAKEVSIVNDIKKLKSGEVPEKERTVVADDWVILKFKNDPGSNYKDAVSKWKDDKSDGQDYIIIGYPGGRTAFDGDVVKPTELPAPFPFREESNGTLKLQGSQTVAGTSGGGIFDSKNNAFTGIHRSRIDSTVQVQAVSAKKIREILRERGYEPPRSDVSSSSKQTGFHGKGVKLQFFELDQLHSCLQVLLGTNADELVGNLLVGMDLAARGLLPAGDIPSKRLLNLLDAVNETGILISGEFPLKIVLDNAIFQLGKRPEVNTVRMLRDRITITWLAEKLKQTFEWSSTNEKQLAEIYAQCLPELIRRQIRFSQEKINESLENLFNIKYNEQFAEFGFAACVFAVAIGETLSVMPDVEEWIRHATEEMKWKFRLEDVKPEARLAIKRIQANKVSPIEDSQVTEHLQVKVTVLSADNTQVNAEFFSWSQQDKLNLVRDNITTTLTELPNDIYNRLANHTTLVELFLPTELMFGNFEFAGEKKEECLIVEHIVVRRFADRQKVPNITKQTMATKKQLLPFNNWKERWSKLANEDATMLDLFQPIKLCEFDSTDSISNFKIDLKSKRDICCTGCDVFPDKYFGDLFQSHIDSGVPVMFWPGKSFGESLPPLDLETIKCTLFSLGATSLLKRLRSVQIQYLKESHADFHKGNLFFIYDNPNEMLPTVKPDMNLLIQEEKANG